MARKKSEIELADKNEQKRVFGDCVQMRVSLLCLLTTHKQCQFDTKRPLPSFIRYTIEHRFASIGQRTAHNIK